MAKELPYFKFEPNQWENGNIQMLSREDKGLFIDLCAMYWSRLGDVPFKLANQKLCAGNATALNPLCDEKIIEVIDGNIFIKFLSEQLEEFKDTSKQNSKNAKEGWEKRRKQKDLCDRNATASIPQSESDAIRGDKIRGDKIRGDDKPISINNILLSEIKISDDRKFLNFKNKSISISEKEAINFKTAVWFQKLFIKNLKEKNSPTANQEKATYKNYVTPVRLMFDTDKVTQEQVKQAYDYLNSLEGDFWKKNILSTEKLRQQIQKILINKNTSNGSEKSNSPPRKKQYRFTIDKLEKTVANRAQGKLSKMDSDDPSR